MRETFTVFFFEDDEKTAKDIKKTLQQPPDNPDAPLLSVRHYIRAKDAFDALEKLTTPPHVALLDRHQDNYTNAGFDLCKTIKEYWPNVPVIFLSDYGSIHDMIEGLDVGAIQYLPKTLFKESDHEEFIRKAILAAIRDTTHIDEAPENYRLGSLEVDLDGRRVSWRGRDIRLTDTELGILDALTNPKQAGRPCKYSDLAIAGGIHTTEQDQIRVNVRQHIQKIRRAFGRVDEDFGAACQDGDYGIVAIPKAGYRWKPGPVSETA